MTQLEPFKLIGLFRLEYQKARGRFPILPLEFPGVTITDGVGRIAACYPKFNEDGTRGIKRFTLSQHVVDSKIIDLMRHEIAHAIHWMSGYECSSHGEMWMKFCLEIGGTPSRICHGGIEEDVRKEFLVSRNERRHSVKYEIVCNSCGKIWRKKHYSKQIRAIEQNPAAFWCPFCGKNVRSLELRGVA